MQTFKNLIIGFFGILFLISSVSVDAQNVTIANSTGANGSYATLKAAFDALNAQGTQAGNNITISIDGNTTETASAVLNQPSVSSWASLSITATGSFTVSGSLSGFPLLDLNGVDNVTINGGNTLTFVNTAATNTGNTSTIRLRADATNNVITNCTIKGASTMTGTTGGGTVWFSTGTTTGNDNNTISNCTITSDGGNLVAKAIFSSGTTTNTTLYNSNNTITNCNIADYFHATSISNGIYLHQATADWTINNNKFYQTTARTQTTGTVHAAINVASNTGNNHHTISGNVIGYASSTGTGVYALDGVAGTRFYGIYFSSAGNLQSNKVEGNTITQIAITGVLSGTAANSPFVGIMVVSGLVEIGGTVPNVIGSTTSASVISFNSTSTSASEVFGIYTNQNSSITNNQIGGMTTANTSGAVLLAGMGVASSTTIRNCTIGFVNAKLENTSTNTSSQVIGLHNISGQAVYINNTISYLTTSVGNLGVNAASSVIGIVVNSNITGHNIEQNKIFALSNTNSSAAVNVVGIFYTGNTTGGAHFIQRNLVHSLSVGSNSAGIITGIHFQAGLGQLLNNMVRLGIDETGTAQTNASVIYGIRHTTTTPTNNINNNSVYIGGSNVGSIVSNTFAFFSSVTGGTRSFRNNLFVNARSNATAGSGGKHYAVSLVSTSGATINARPHQYHRYQ